MLSDKSQPQSLEAGSVVPMDIHNDPIESALTYRKFKKVWRLTGRNPPKRFVLLYNLYALFFHFAVTVYLPAATLAQMFLFETIEPLLKDFVFDVEILVVVTKFLIIWRYKEKFQRANELLAILDAQLYSFEERDQIRRITVRTERIYKAYFFLTSFVVIFSASAGFFATPRHLLCEIWFPFEWNASELNFWIAFVYETVSVYMLICMSTINDFYGPMYMMILNGHFDNLAMRIKSIGLRNPKALRSESTESCRKLIDCIKQHKIIMEISTSLEPVISTTMFVQFLITAMALGLCVIDVLYFVNNPFEIAEFISISSAVLLHVFPCCYFAQKFSDNSEKIKNALFSCHWVDESQEFKNLVVLWMGFNQKQRYFLAGKLIPINLSTFVSILKFTYSFATFMKHIKE